jgi:hypothetical protein
LFFPWNFVIVLRKQIQKTHKNEKDIIIRIGTGGGLRYAVVQQGTHWDHFW